MAERGNCIAWQGVAKAILCTAWICDGGSLHCVVSRRRDVALNSMGEAGHGVPSQCKGEVKHRIATAELCLALYNTAKAMLFIAWRSYGNASHSAEMRCKGKAVYHTVKQWQGAAHLRYGPSTLGIVTSGRGTQGAITALRGASVIVPFFLLVLGDRGATL